MSSPHKPAGEAILIVGGIMAINQTNGKFELYQGPTIIGGLSTGNLADMLSSLAAVQQAWAAKTELTTDESSPDDK
jgi:hypothetical protein